MLVGTLSSECRFVTEQCFLSESFGEASLISKLHISLKIEGRKERRKKVLRKEENRNMKSGSQLLILGLSLIHI